MLSTDYKCSVRNTKKIPVALLFAGFLITFMTCKTGTGLNLNSTVAVLI